MSFYTHLAIQMAHVYCLSAHGNRRVPEGAIRLDDIYGLEWSKLQGLNSLLWMELMIQGFPSKIKLFTKHKIKIGARIIITIKSVHS